MKKIIPLILLLAVTLTGCDSMHGNDGDLRGLWQVIGIADRATDQTVVKKDAGVYYAFELGLMKIYTSRHPSQYFLATYTHEGNQIQLQRIVTYGRFAKEGTQETYPSETEVNASTPDLQTSLHDEYGIPADGTLHILSQGDGQLQLQTADRHISLRHY